MIVQSSATRDIVLPSGHRIRAGQTMWLPARILASDRNRDFVRGKVAAHMLVLAEDEAPEDGVVAQDFETPHSRLAVAVMSYRQLIALGNEIGIPEPGTLTEDALRLEIAERLFE